MAKHSSAKHQCELCGMLSDQTVRDNHGVTHHYCHHHAVQQNNRHNHHSASDHKAHDAHAGHSTNMFRDRFWLSALLTIPIVAYSDMVQQWLGFSMPVFTGSDLIPPVLGSIIFFYGGWVFIQSAYRELLARQPGMMTLIAQAIIAAYLYSLATIFLIDGMDFFWELATLISVMLLGHWIEMSSVSRAQGDLQELAKLLPDRAEKISGENIESVSLENLSSGDIVLVRPGAKVPADGVVVDGQSNVNESMITGESKPVSKNAGDKVIAGTVNSSGSLKVEVAQTGEGTVLSGIMRMISEAQKTKSKTQVLADKAAFYLTVIASSTAALTLVYWIYRDSTDFAIERAVTVLVIACPHALGLAVPLVTSISTTLASKNGFLVRQRASLESARNINVVLFDKTGTLTRGEHGVVDIWPTKNSAEEEVLSLAASVESDSEHVIGRAITDKARKLNISVAKASGFESIPGKGVKGFVQGQSVSVGGPRLLEHLDAKISDTAQQNSQQAGVEGKTIVYVLRDKELLGSISLADVIREESKQAVSELKKRGIRVAMLTGDSKDVAAYIAKNLGIKEYFAEVLPEHKVDKVKELQKNGGRVAMVGDGINDAPALTQADIGIAIGAGTDVAIESAGIILVKNDPRDVVKVIELSKSTYRKMAQNLVWATGYNIVAIPLAAGVLASQGIILAPAVGAALMSVSTVIVAINAQLLRRIKLSK